MRRHVDMTKNIELEIKKGEASGIKEKEVEIVKKLHSLNTPIEKIAEIVNISTEEVKQIIK